MIWALYGLCKLGSPIRISKIEHPMITAKRAELKQLVRSYEAGTL